MCPRHCIHYIKALVAAAVAHFETWLERLPLHTEGSISRCWNINICGSLSLAAMWRKRERPWHNFIIFQIKSSPGRLLPLFLPSHIPDQFPRRSRAALYTCVYMFVCLHWCCAFTICIIRICAAADCHTIIYTYIRTTARAVLTDLLCVSAVANLNHGQCYLTLMNERALKKWSVSARSVIELLYNVTWAYIT
jgi:hypothetical protein